MTAANDTCLVFAKEAGGRGPPRAGTCCKYCGVVLEQHPKTDKETAAKIRWERTEAGRKAEEASPEPVLDPDDCLVFSLGRRGRPRRNTPCCYCGVEHQSHPSAKAEVVSAVKKDRKQGIVKPASAYTATTAPPSTPVVLRPEPDVRQPEKDEPQFVIEAPKPEPAPEPDPERESRVAHLLELLGDGPDIDDW